MNPSIFIYHKFKQNQFEYLYKFTNFPRMPQLPQVQTVRKFLSQVLLHPKPKKLTSVRINYPPMIKQPTPQLFTKYLIGQSFTQIDRYGKYLILKLEEHSIISHLRMEGKYFFYGGKSGKEGNKAKNQEDEQHQNKYQRGKHDHVQFGMSDGSLLVYSDVRKFGTMCLVKKGKEMDHKSLSKLGPEANQDQFDIDHLANVCQNKKTSIKQILLDQQNVCGIGNIYVDQILYSSGIHPETQGSQLSQSQLSSITSSSKFILNKAIVNKGTTFRSFASNHQAGQFQNCLQVYGREGEKCQKCGSTIKKIKVGGRGTHYCGKCQRKSGGKLQENDNQIIQKQQSQPEKKKQKQKGKEKSRNISKNKRNSK